MNYSPPDRRLTDAELLSNFRQATLARENWTHLAHVRVAYLHLGQLSFPDAAAELRKRILALNAYHGTPETPTRGYHETITVAFLRLVAHAREKDAATQVALGDSLQFCARHPELLDKKILQRHYSPEILASAEARKQFVEPDLLALPGAGNPELYSSC